jgi:hypothetical protein
MTKTLHARFDGEVFRPEPEESLPLAPNTRVLITVEEEEELSPGESLSFLATARSLKLQGPEDWSERLEDYLYGDASLED